MKKLLMVLCLMLMINLAGFSQYKNLKINEKVYYMGDTLDSVYVNITNVMIFSLHSFKAVYFVDVYKSYEIFVYNPEWKLMVAEIPNKIEVTFSPEFGEGNLMLMISEELKRTLLEKNTFWQEANIIIEQ